MSRQRILIALGAFGVVFLALLADLAGDTHLGSLVLLTALGGLAQWEVFALFRRMGLDSHAGPGTSAAVVLLLARGLLPEAGLDPFECRAVVGVLFAGIAVAPLAAAVFRPGGEGGVGREETGRAAATAFGLLVVWFLLGFLLEVRLLPDVGGVRHTGLKLALLLVLAAKLGDSAAYVAGRTLGRTSMTWVSPRKTWEGAAASWIAAGATGLVAGAAFGFPWWQTLLLGLVTNPAGQLGDLLESLLKRRSGVKDSGTLLREMGGFLDVLDSLLLAGPVGYLFVSLVMLP